MQGHADPPDLLLTDVVLPQMTGTQLARTMRQRYPDLKVLYMSGYADNPSVFHGVGSAGAEFLQKPFTPGSLSGKVRALLDG